MISAIVIDDEPLARNIILEFLKEYPQIQLLAECSNGLEGLKAIQSLQPTLVFLDIQMPKINGFEMLELLDSIPEIVFTTAYDEFAIKAFEAQAIDYLLKPFSQERFNKAIHRFLNTHSNLELNSKLINNPIIQPEEQNRVVVKNGNDIKIIPTIEIFYFEAYDDYVKIHTKDFYVLKKKTMNHFEKVLDSKNFQRVHRSYIIQLKKITKIEVLEKNNHIAILSNGAKIPLSRNGYIKLKEELGL